MELSPTAKVILGMLSMGPKSGYEIKCLVDRSTRFFWAASYGQIYPELRRLAEAGLVDGTESPQGGRKRTVYRLTRAGKRTLERWLGTPPQVLEMRHEGMLKVFFADALDPNGRGDRIHDMAAQHREKAALLREVEAGTSRSPDSSAHLVLRFGIEFNDWVAEWCERAADEFAPGTVAQRSA